MGTPEPRWWLALVGVLGIAAGAITLIWPGITGFILLLFIAGWAIAAGVFEIVGALKLRKEIEGEWWLVATGILSVLFGLLILMFPGVGALGIAFAIGWFAILYRSAARWLFMAAQEACSDQNLTLCRPIRRRE